MKPQVQEGSFPCAYGKYQLLARIGQGGMAEVFRARLPGVAGFEKIVVIKRLFPHLAREPGIVEMFVNEAKIAAGVAHRNVVEVYELGQTEDGEFYIAMEHVAGTDLRQILRGAALSSMRIPPWFSVHVMVEVLEGLAYVHALCEPNGRPRNIVHRDVTPANIFVSQLGDIKLGDFGVAKDESRSSKTKAGQLKGKIPYMSPEQLYSRELDGRSDVFAAGVVLWECLTQRRLFGGRPDIEAMNLICSSERRSPSSLASDIPRELDEVLLGALQPDPAHRTRSAVELQSQLLEVLRRLRPHVHQSEVRGVVEVLVGNVESHGVTGPTSTSESGVKSFSEPTPPFDGAKEGQARAGSTPGARLVALPVPSLSSHPAAAASSSEQFPRAMSPRPVASSSHDLLRPPSPRPVPSSSHDFPGAPSPRPSANPFSSSSSHDTPRSMSMPQLPAVMDPFATTGAERQVTDDYPRELLSPLYAPTNLPALDAQGHAPRAEPLAGPPPSRFPPRLSTPVRPNYEGAHPMYVRTHQGQVLGPMGYADALSLLFQEARAGFVDEVGISTTTQSFLDANTFGILTGQELLLDAYAEKEKPMPSVRFTGTLGHTSAPSLFARISREKPSGRLVIAAQVFGQNLRREITLREGRPTFVYGNSVDVQFPQLLLERRVVTRDHLGALLHRVIVEERPLDELVALETGIEAQRTFGSLMKERLVDIFRWSIGYYALDLEAPITYTTPFAHSMVALAPELVTKTQTIEDLRELLAPYMEVQLERAVNFSRGLAELGLPERESQAVMSFSSAPLSEIIKPGARHEHLYLALAYTMIEAGHLVPPL